MNTTNAVYTSESYATDYKPEKSIYQDDARIFHRGGLTYDSVVAVKRAGFVNGVLTAHVALDSGALALLAVIPVADGILRFKFWPANVAPDFEETSEMLISLKMEPPVGTFTEQVDAYLLTDGGLWKMWPA